LDRVALTGSGIPPQRPDRIAPDEPPGIVPLPDEPPPPDLPETEPLPPDTDQPGRGPEEFPAPQESPSFRRGSTCMNRRNAA
jgi:hypothetical protein